MSDAGDIHLADINDEVQRRVLVLSKRRFHQLSGRAVVAPEWMGPLDDPPDPWRIRIDGREFAMDHLTTIPLNRLLGRVGRAPLEAMLNARLAITQIV